MLPPSLRVLSCDRQAHLGLLPQDAANLRCQGRLLLPMLRALLALTWKRHAQGLSPQVRCAANLLHRKKLFPHTLQPPGPSETCMPQALT